MSAHVALIVVAVVVPASNCLHFDRCIWPCSCCHLKVVAIVGFTHCGRTATAIEVDVAAAVSVAILEQEKLPPIINCPGKRSRRSSSSSSCATKFCSHLCLIYSLQALQTLPSSPPYECVAFVSPRNEPI